MKKLICLSVLLFIAILCVALCVRVSARYLALHKLDAIPRVKERLAIMPSQKVYLAPDSSSNVVSLGYAKFFLPEGLSFGRGRLIGRAETCILLTNEYCSITMLSPFRVGAERGVEIEIEVEKSSCPAFVDVITLKSTHFLDLMRRLAEKGGTTRGYAGVYSYRANLTTGLVRIGDNGGDKSCASVSLSANAGDMNVGFHVRTKEACPLSISVILDTILSSFQFSIDAIPDEERLREIIRSALKAR